MKKMIFASLFLLLFTPALAKAEPGKCTVESGRTVCELPNPMPGTTSVPQVVKLIINAALSVIGAITLLMFVYGGFTWLTSAGKEDKVKEGTQTMVWAAIGVVLVFSSYLLLSAFMEYLTKAGQ